MVSHAILEMIQNFKEKYEDNKTQLINNKIVSIGDPLFKLSNSESWSILIQVEKERVDCVRRNRKKVKGKEVKSMETEYNRVDVGELPPSTSHCTVRTGLVYGATYI